MPRLVILTNEMKCCNVQYFVDEQCHYDGFLYTMELKILLFTVDVKKSI